ncbi:MAG: S9 family peptidase [Thermoanaerobaculia bacterium]|nr:S9 family peptidase [Thermoanaerobaculia bacterium]
MLFFARSALTSARQSAILSTAALFVLVTASPSAGAGLDFDHLAALHSVGEVKVAPDGSLVAYTLSLPRIPGDDEDGSSWNQLWIVSADGESAPRPFVHGQVRVSDISFSPDGRLVYYRAQRGDDDHQALWAVPVAGGESRRMLVHKTGIGSYDVSPDGSRVVFLATDEKDELGKKAAKRGYDAVVFEEDWRHAGLWLAELPPFHPTPSMPGAEKEEPEAPRRLVVDGTTSSPSWSADGKHILTAVQPRNLIDDRYMKRKVQLYDADSGERVAAWDNPGKLGAYRLSPDGQHVAMVSAADPNDTREGRLLVGSIGEGTLRDLMPDFEAHVNDLRWQSPDTILWSANTGSETTVGTVSLTGQVQKLFQSGPAGGGAPIVSGFSAEGCTVALAGETPTHPDEVFLYRPCDANAEPRRLTDSNPWLEAVRLAKQEVITWEASDGLELEGILIHPLEGSRNSDGPAPLLLMVHGGPEANDRNGWVTNYSRPGQLAAAQGFAVLYPNYRGSTGRGVEFAKTSQGDAAGKEFLDLVEAVDHLVAVGVADKERVGITGGSYGGYATAWCSTYHSSRFRAGVMFVGISNKLSKGFTTDIPVEDKMVHTRFDPWENWEFSLDRSPLYHAEKSTTALLIAGGDADTRVHPSQSLQLYRAFKLMGKTVRYVRYPGEPHGNRRAASRDDYARRLMRWMIHFVRDGESEVPDKILPSVREMVSDTAEDDA